MIAIKGHVNMIYTLSKKYLQESQNPSEEQLGFA